MFENILVVCIGNICRSPLAEAMLKEKLQGLPNIVISSAGLSALVDAPVHSHVAQRCELDLSNHRARQISVEMIHNADIILTMDEDQSNAVISLSPQARSKTFSLGKWDGMSILDPYNKDDEAFDKAHNDIDQCTTSWANKIKSLTRTTPL